MTGHDWMVPGAEVVELTPHRTYDTGRIEETTIDRVLKRDVVLANGNRYRADYPRKTRGPWDSATELLPADDPRVQQVREANERMRIINSALYDAEKIVGLLQQLKGGYRKTTETPHADLAKRLSALTQLIAALDVLDNEADR